MIKDISGRHKLPLVSSQIYFSLRFCSLQFLYTNPSCFISILTTTSLKASGQVEEKSTLVREEDSIFVLLHFNQRLKYIFILRYKDLFFLISAF